MAFYLAIKVDLTSKIATMPAWVQDPDNAIVLYDQVRGTRVAATLLEFPRPKLTAMIPFSSIRTIGGI